MLEGWRPRNLWRLWLGCRKNAHRFIQNVQGSWLLQEWGRNLKMAQRQVHFTLVQLTELPHRQLLWGDRVATFSAPLHPYQHSHAPKHSTWSPKNIPWVARQRCSWPWAVHLAWVWSLIQIEKERESTIWGRWQQLGLGFYWAWPCLMDNKAKRLQYCRSGCRHWRILRTLNWSFRHALSCLELPLLR